MHSYSAMAVREGNTSPMPQKEKKAETGRASNKVMLRTSIKAESMRKSSAGGESTTAETYLAPLDK